MAQYGWTNSPPALRRQTAALVAGLREALGENLLGVYLHGSLALGCFNPQRSDLDVLVVTRASLAGEERPRLARLLLELSAMPSAVEISVLSHPGLHPWRHPAPYEFHFSEDWRDRTQAHLDSGTWPELDAAPTDADLAAHVTIALERGICLWGAPAAEVFPRVPAADYADAIVTDFCWGRDLRTVNPVYFVLNACRVLAFLEEGLVLSKDEGGEWGLRHLPAVHHPIMRQALRTYRGVASGAVWHKAGLESFAEAVSVAVEGHSRV
jgi:predicted nucleotidyltransferase